MLHAVQRGAQGLSDGRVERAAQRLNGGEVELAAGLHDRDVLRRWTSTAKGSRSGISAARLPTARDRLTGDSFPRRSGAQDPRTPRSGGQESSLRSTVSRSDEYMTRFSHQIRLMSLAVARRSVSIAAVSDELGGGRGVYSIGAVARMLGIPAATIRNWEERYGTIVPERSPGGTASTHATRWSSCASSRRRCRAACRRPTLIGCWQTRAKRGQSLATDGRNGGHAAARAARRTRSRGRGPGGVLPAHRGLRRAPGSGGGRRRGAVAREQPAAGDR